VVSGSGVAALCRDEEEEGQRGFSRRRGRTSTISTMEMMRMRAALQVMGLVYGQRSAVIGEEDRG
jgi:hypothetical protein